MRGKPMRCEDFPCCGHTNDDPCGVQWYDEPGAFDTSRPGNEHALCEHEYGICDVEPDDEDDEDDEDYADVPDFAGEDAFLDSYWDRG
jgi:hypothetical protein